MEYEVPSIVETKMTGWVGTGHRKVRGVCHSVRFTRQAGEFTGMPSRNGKPCDWSKTTRKMFDAGFRFFCA